MHTSGGSKPLDCKSEKKQEKCGRELPKLSRAGQRGLQAVQPLEKIPSEIEQISGTEREDWDLAGGFRFSLLI